MSALYDKLLAEARAERKGTAPAARRACDTRRSAALRGSVPGTPIVDKWVKAP